ncbi:MAG: hypothetical protein ACYDDU_10250 [Dermatophilaceae bacterium]
MSTYAACHLKHLLVRVGAFPVLWTGPSTELVPGRGPDRLLFTAPGGGVLRNTNFRSRVFERAKADLGLPALCKHGVGPVGLEPTTYGL